MPDQPNDSHTIFMPIVQGGTHKPLQQPAIYIDLRRCIGCNACSLACKQENNVSIGERWNEVYGIESLSSLTLDIRVMPMYCQHCNNAPCKQKCDSLGYHAIIQRPDGIVYIDPAKCVGCQQCLSSVNIRRYTSTRRPVKWKSATFACTGSIRAWRPRVSSHVWLSRVSLASSLTYRRSILMPSEWVTAAGCSMVIWAKIRARPPIGRLAATPIPFRATTEAL